MLKKFPSNKVNVTTLLFFYRDLQLITILLLIPNSNKS